MELAQGPYYRWSGRFSASGVAIALAVGLASAALFGTIYAYANLYIPVVGIVSALLAGALAFGTGTLTSSALRSGQVRNPAVAYAVLAIAAVAALYCEWAVWMYAFLRRSGLEANLLALVKDPRLLWRSILVVNESGAWQFRSTTPTGIALWIPWGAEALAIVGGTFFVGVVGWDAAPFCESCGTWCHVLKGVGLFAELDRAELRRRMEAHDFGAIEKLGPPTGPRYLRLDLAACRKCGQTHTASVELVVVAQKNGKDDVTTTTWVERLVISPAEEEALRAASARVAEAARRPLTALT